MTETITDAQTEWIKGEQAALWHELFDAIDRAINGVWSIDAADKARRIVAAARLVGPTRTGELPYALVAGGVFAAVLTAGGLPVETITEDEWIRLDTMMERHGGTRQTARPRYAAVVATIQTPREQEWINGEGE